MTKKEKLIDHILAKELRERKLTSYQKTPEEFLEIIRLREKELIKELKEKK